MINNLNYEVFNQVNSWNEFKNSLEQFYNYDYSLIGKKFEIFAKYYFLFEPTVKDDYKNVWLYKEIPDEVKTFLNITNQDYGIDLVLEDFDNNFYAVQCKFRKNEEEKLSWTKDRIGNLFGYSNKVKSYIVFANTYDIDNISKTRENFYFLNVSDLQNLDTQFFSKIFLYIKENIKQTVYVKYEPREHQKLAIEKA